MAKHPYNRTVFQSLALVSQFGITMLVPIAMMFVVGYWLDLKLKTSFFAVVLFFIGALAGFSNVYRLARKIYGRKERKD
ncbi:MAG: AtpZ/AtpI family protein [Lachnospiraceae bacterium]|nr:AtpZ/AtpI family protein [Lachnospiraceae bacterium]